MTPGVIPMIAPDGTTGDIPSNRQQDALNAGFKLAVVMTSPDGRMGYVPRERAADAMKAGFKVGQPTTSAEQSGPPAAYGFTPGNLVKNVGRGLSELGQGVVQGLDDVGGAILPQRLGGDPITQTKLVEHIVQPMQAEAAKARELQAQGQPYVGHAMASGIPLIGPYAANLGDQAATGDIGGMVARAGTQYAAPLAAAKALPVALKAGGKIVPRGAMAERMVAIPAGEQFSRGEVLQAARDNGVNLDAAQATGSGALEAAKKANRYSLASQGTYEAAQTKNLAALDEWANKEASKYSPASADREAVGGQIQQTLKNTLAEDKTAASTKFTELDSRAPINVDATATVEAEAKKIIADNKDYYAAHPELKPKQAWGVLEDLAKRPQIEETIAGKTRLVDAPSKMMSWSELHQLRSDLMDFYRNNPDIVKGRSDAWIQRMVSKVDEAMTGASSGLKPEDLTTFREANQVWENIKKTYDSPGHPFYHAVRSQFPSQVPGMLSKGTPELASQVRATLGELDGPFQRQFVETLINSKDGALDLGRLNQKLKGIPQDHLEAMLGAKGAKQLRLLGKVSQKVFSDANPSGTAKVGVPAAEVSGLFTAPIATGAELVAQRVGAKLMNSQKFVDYLTKPRQLKPQP